MTTFTTKYNISIAANDGAAEHIYTGTVSAINETDAFKTMKNMINSEECKEDEATAYNDTWNDLNRSFDDYMTSIVSIKQLTMPTIVHFLCHNGQNGSISVTIVPSEEYKSFSYKAIARYV